MNVDSIPFDLRQVAQWVVWARENRNGKQTKVPRIASRPSANASVSDPTTWATFDLALQALQQQPQLVDGIGFVLTMDDAFVGIDIDDCIADDGTIAPEIAALVAQLDSYTEVSPSGRGLRVFLRGRFRHPLTGTPGGNAPFPGCKKIEIYFASRFLTVTGNQFPGTPTAIGERQNELDCLVAKLWPGNASGNSSTNSSARNGEAQQDPNTLSDDELLDRARAAKDGDKFVALFDRGDISAYDNDESRADAALCCLLAYWTGGSHERIERLFSRSALVREKWTDRKDYRDRTISAAIKKVAQKLAQAARGQLPLIRVETDIQTVADLAEAALRAQAQGLIYQTAEALVHVTQDKPGKKKEVLARAPRAPRIVIMEAARLRELLSMSARFEQQRGGQGGAQPRFKPVLPPKWLVETLLARRQWDLPRLDGIAEAPFLRLDGTIADLPGYDAATGILYLPQPGLELPPIPDMPTADDARRAIDVLLDPLQGFAFVTKADRSTAVAAILTGLARFAIQGPTPSARRSEGPARPCSRTSSP